MKEIEGLEKKEFVVTIEWVLDASILIEDGTQEGMDYLRETGSADITNIQLRTKGVK